MKAIAVTPGKKQVALIDAPEPLLKNPTDVKLKMLEIGVCGTDKEICAFEYGTPPAGSDYLIIGHESLGRVIETGAAVSALKAGDLVVMVVRRPCGKAECGPCAAGRQDFCQTGAFTERGINGVHGFMTEKVVDDEKYMNPVPEPLRGIAVLAEPLTIAEKGLEQMWQIQSRLPWDCIHAKLPKAAGIVTRSSCVLGAPGPWGSWALCCCARRALALSFIPKNPWIAPKQNSPNKSGRLLFPAPPPPWRIWPPKWVMWTWSMRPPALPGFPMR